MNVGDPAGLWIHFRRNTVRLPTCNVTLLFEFEHPGVELVGIPLAHDDDFFRHTGSIAETGVPARQLPVRDRGVNCQETNSMPQAIVVALGSAGDVHPNVGLALALRRRGWDVLLIATQVFGALAERTGLNFAGVGSEQEYLAALRDPDLWHPFRSYRFVVTRLVLPAMRPVYELIEKHYRPGETIVTAPPLAFGARVAQEKLGLPLATVHLQPVLLRSAIQPGCFGFPDLLSHMPPVLRRLYFRSADQWLLDPPLLGPLNEFRAELGLPPVRRIFHDWIHSPQMVLGLFPEWFGQPQPDWPPNTTLAGFPLWDEAELRTISPELEYFLADGQPPLVFTAGSAMLQAGKFFRMAAEVCEATGHRGILLSQFHEQLPAQLPASVRHFDYIPFSMVLPRSAALVHHGGIGTTAQAIAAGIPQLIVPHTHDQPDNAVRVQRLGIGDYLQPSQCSTRRVSEKLQFLLGPSTRTTCERIARKIDSGGLERASTAVEQLLTKHRVPVATEVG